MKTEVALPPAQRTLPGQLQRQARRFGDRPFVSLPGAQWVQKYRLLERGDPAALGALAALRDDPVAAFHTARLRRGEQGARVEIDEK